MSLRKTKQRKFPLEDGDIVSHLKSEITAFDELFHLASLEMFAGKPQMKPHALLVCSLGNVLA